MSARRRVRAGAAIAPVWGIAAESSHAMPCMELDECGRSRAIEETIESHAGSVSGGG